MYFNSRGIALSYDGLNKDNFTANITYIYMTGDPLYAAWPVTIGGNYFMANLSPNYSAYGIDAVIEVLSRGGAPRYISDWLARYNLR